jgi:hypothetical protein
MIQVIIVDAKGREKVERSIMESKSTVEVLLVL